MAPRPPELREDIERTRQHLGDVMDELQTRVDTATAATRRHLDPGHLARQHKGTFAAIASGAGLIVLWMGLRVTRGLARRRRRPVAFELITKRRGRIAELLL